MFEIVPVDRSLAESPEQLGTKRKYWYRVGDRRLLFKAEERGTGEDWAEKVANSFCEKLSLPHVHYDLAVETASNTPGVICESCVKRPASLVLGNQVMLALDPKYPAANANKYKVKEHTVEAVSHALDYLNPPSAEWMDGTPSGIESSQDVFIGYVMLDAWIANQDRHHENWGVVVGEGSPRLAPTFDHGAAMARNLTDEDRGARLASKDRNQQVEAFAGRARSAFFDGNTTSKSMLTMDAWRAFAIKSPQAAHLWLARLATIDEATMEKVLLEVPQSRMSAICREFTLRLLVVNWQRLLKD